MFKHLAAALLLFVLMPIFAGAQTDPLSEHRWSSRVLLVLAENADDPDARKTRESLALSGCELTDRDMIIGWIFSGDESRIDGRRITPDAAQALRSRLRASPGEFLAVLVGKDGGVKARYGEAPALSEVFDLIDGMPMRRSEQRQRGLNCEDS